MVEGGCGTRASAEPFERLRVMSHIFGQELQRDETTKFGVFRLVNDTHASTAQLLDDAVVRDGLPNQLGGVAHWRKY
ncbi:MAG TPA: hypothetical protein VEI01_24290 [Terriglobales bacterium]|nr:hypothetical protein [Terriglobales bacterium]